MQVGERDGTLSFVALDTVNTKPATKVGKRVWRKQVLRFGKWEHPQDPSRTLDVTPGLVQRLAENFRDGVRDVVAVPSEHTDDWQKNRGRVVGLEPAADGLYATLEVDPSTDKDIEEGRALAVSAMFDEDYYDLESRERKGPVMRHICLTNVPVVKRLKGFEPVLLSEGVQPSDVVFLSEVEVKSPMDLEQMLKELKEKHGIDVEALKEGASRHEQSTAAVAAVREALTGSGVSLSEDASLGDAVKALAAERKQEQDTRTSLEKKVDELTTSLSEVVKATLRKDAESTLAPYIARGYIEKANEAHYVSLAEQHGVEHLRLTLAPFDKLPAPKALGAEVGTTAGGAPPVVTASLSEEDAASEAERLIKLGRESGLIRTATVANAA